VVTPHVRFTSPDSAGASDSAKATMRTCLAAEVDPRARRTFNCRSAFSLQRSARKALAATNAKEGPNLAQRMLLAHRDHIATRKVFYDQMSNS